MAVTPNLGLTKLEVGQAQKEPTINTNYDILDGAVSGGTSFPGTPATNRRFFRSDRSIEYFYNGTRWLSTQLFTDPIPRGDAGPLPYTATAAGAERILAPYAGTYDLWLIELQLGFNVSGGTALSGSHKWVSELFKQTSGGSTSVATINIDSGSSGVWRVAVASIGALLGITNLIFRTDHTKTGTPGDLYVVPRIVYRLVG